MNLQGGGRYLTAGVIGFGAGSCLGLVGWGGAQIIIPSLTGLGMSQLAASSTSLASLGCSVITGAGQFVLEDKADLSVAAAIALPSMLGARLGSLLAARLLGEVHALIFNGMSVILLPTHFLVQRRRQQLDEAAAAAKSTTESSDTVCEEQNAAAAVRETTTFGREDMRALTSHSAFGLFSGILSALMGVGGLPITMSYLTLCVPELPHHLVQGTAMVSVAPAVVVSSASHAFAGHTPLGIAACVTCGGITGSVVGAQAALRLEEVQLRQLYMLSLLVLGGRSFIGAGLNIHRLMRARSRGGR